MALGFWIAAAVLGLMIGPNQAASRSLLSKLVPDDKQAEFFGLYSFSGKVSSLLGPLVYGTVVARTGDADRALAHPGTFRRIHARIAGRARDDNFFSYPLRAFSSCHQSAVSEPASASAEVSEPAPLATVMS